MPIVESQFASPHDLRFAAELADHATSAAPAWLWATDGLRILWANAVGATIFGATNISDCTARRFDTKHPAAMEITRLAATLPPAGQARLERLRGFGLSFGRALTCICSRFALSDGSSAILVRATEAAGPALTLAERAARLFPDRDGALAVFAPDGALLYATAAAQTWLGRSASLSALGLADPAAQALATGRAGGVADDKPVSIERLGSDASTVLVVGFAAPKSVQAEGAAANTEPAGSPPAQPAASSADPTAPTRKHAARDETPAERRHPLRFVWQMAADGHFVVGSDEFVELMGPRTTAAFGRLWSEIATELKLDPDNQVVRAVATRETWSGITLDWPVDEGGARLPVELSGLPVFDREREFRGYRGFGVCRDVARINELSRQRRERPVGFGSAPETPPPTDTAAATLQSLPPVVAEIAAPAQPGGEPAREAPTPDSGRSAPTIVPAAANVVPFRQTPLEPRAPSLSPVERKAFGELAQELTARLRGGHENGDAAANADGLPGAQQENPSAAVEPAAVASEHDNSKAALQSIDPACESALLDRIPLGVLIYRQEALLYANRHFLELSGYASLDALAAAGGLHALFAEPDAGALAQDARAQSLSIMPPGGDRRPVEGRLFSVPWGEAFALALVLTNGEAAERQRSAALSLGTAESEIRALKSKLESVKSSEDELRAATREAQRAAAAKAEFVNKVSHEIRTPLNAITGFAEVMMAERFGPIGNDRYRDYLKDIHAAGMHLVSLLNDLLDLSKIETGQVDMTFANVSLNELTQQCVGIMQPQASRARIIIRTSLTPGLPQVVADERSLRQIVLNLLSNSIRFTGPGGQVIVSTAFADSGEAVLRVRDTGVGMSEKDVAAALEPFRQTATSGSWGSGGTGLGLPLTKALAEANRAHFSIKSAPNAGTLIEVAFPRTRVVAR
jgi:signal transduction histidine kinase